MQNVSELREQLGLTSMPTLDSTAELLSDIVEGRGVADAAFGILFALGQGWNAMALPVQAPAVSACGFEVRYDAGRDMLQITGSGDRTLLDSALESGAFVAHVDEGMLVSLGSNGAVAIPTASGGTLFLERDQASLRASLHGAPVDASLPAWAPDPASWLSGGGRDGASDAIGLLAASQLAWDRVAAAGLVARHPGVVAPAGSPRVSGDAQRPWLGWITSVDDSSIATIQALAARHAVQLEREFTIAFSAGDPMGRSWWSRLDALRVRRERLEGVAVLLGARRRTEGLAGTLAAIDRAAVIALAVAPALDDVAVTPLLTAVGLSDPDAWWGA